MDRLIGEELRARNVLSRADLADALVEQRRQGDLLGRILLANGSVSRRDLYSALAAVWGHGFVDLVAEPPEHALVVGIDPDLLLRGRWVPLRRERRGTREIVVVAAARKPDARLDDEVIGVLGGDAVDYVITTDWDVERAVLAACEGPVVEQIAYGLAKGRPELSASHGDGAWFPRWSVIFPVGVVVAYVVWPLAALFATLVVLNTFLFVLILFKVVVCAIGLRADRRARREAEEHDVLALDSRIPDSQLPVYTILVPAYHEAGVVSKVIEHLSELDYPKSKLQVLVLLEPDDVDTIEAAKSARPPDWVRFYVVPPGGPQTKPRACNLGLALAQGDYLTIYDAEDRPQPDQLRQALAAFAEGDERTVCVQARLNYFNSRENVLTRLFTIEYTTWFDAMLPGLDAMRIPIPLGGTSNHFRVDRLRELGGWDPYNVTEDADLGIRASAEGFHIGTIPSTTWEEGCSEWRAWVRQRTRWIKGYMVTTFVHLRRPRRLVQTLGWRGLVGFFLLVAGTPITFLVYPLVVGFWLVTFLGGFVPGFHLPSWAGTAVLVNLLTGTAAMATVSGIAVWRRHARDLVPFVLLNPFYWVLHSVAAWRALVQLVRSPFHWEKTPHGIEHGPHTATAPLQRRKAA